MSTTHDLSRTQFVKMLTRRGFERVGFLGYWRLPLADRRICVSELNGGTRLRDRLAYLLKELDRREVPS